MKAFYIYIMDEDEGDMEPRPATKEEVERCIENHELVQFVQVPGMIRQLKLTRPQ
jgi:hypothetical protein